METKTVVKWGIALLIGVGVITIGFRFAAWLLTVFFIINCLVLIIVVLLQSGKAADLAGAFGGAGSQTAFGPRGAANVLSKATTWCALIRLLVPAAPSSKRFRSQRQSRLRYPPRLRQLMGLPRRLRHQLHPRPRRPRPSPTRSLLPSRRQLLRLLQQRLLRRSLVPSNPTRNQLLNLRPLRSQPQRLRKNPSKSA